MFLYFFELVAHWREVHDFNSHLLWYHYDALTLEEHKERDSNLCVDHAIWTGRRILKLASNFECLFTFLFISRSKKKMNHSAIFITKSPNHF